MEAREDAVKQAESARRSADQAKDSEGKAQNAEKLATLKAGEAAEEKKKALEVAGRERQARQEILDLMLSSSLRTAQTEWNNGNVVQARRVLDDLQTMGWDLPVIEPAKQSEVKRNPIFSAADLLRQHFAGGYATLYGHEGDVQAVEFTPDGKYLVSAGTDGSVRIWDAVTGLQVRTWKAAEKQITAMAVSPDGQTVVTAERVEVRHTRGLEKRGRVSLWNIGDGNLERVFETPDAKDQFIPKVKSTIPRKDPLGTFDNSVMRLIFSPEGRYLFGHTAETPAIVWEIPTGRVVREQPKTPSSLWFAAEPKGGALWYALTTTVTSSTKTDLAVYDWIEDRVVRLIPVPVSPRSRFGRGANAANWTASSLALDPRGAGWQRLAGAACNSSSLIPAKNRL